MRKPGEPEPAAPGPRQETPTPQGGKPDDCGIVPDYDVRLCLVCGRPMEGRKCKYVCRTCGTMTDCSDAY